MRIHLCNAFPRHDYQLQIYYCNNSTHSYHSRVINNIAWYAKVSTKTLPPVLAAPYWLKKHYHGTTYILSFKNFYCSIIFRQKWLKQLHAKYINKNDKHSESYMWLHSIIHKWASTQRLQNVCLSHYSIHTLVHIWPLTSDLWPYKPFQ